MSPRPTTDEYFEYYATYINQVPDGDILQLAERQVSEMREFLGGISEAESMVVHPPYTWTIKQVVGHMIDAERIFADRLHRISSGDPQPQPGMDQDPYVANHDYEEPTLQVLLEELLLCRQANLLLIRRLKPTAWDVRGVASGYTFTVRALVWILVGHITHHLKIVRKRIGTSVE
jgi:DinB superfamily